MDKIKYFTIILLIGFFTSCEVHTSNNGDLDGNWQMVQMDSVVSGKVTNMKGSGIFYAVYVHLLQVHGAGTQISFHFKHSGDSLELYSPYADYGQNDQPVEDVSVLKPYGINRLREVFHVDALSSSKMILSTQEVRLYFRKY